MQVVVVGAGVFGVAAALELARRGHAVTLTDRRSPPHPCASSTDLSKIVRSDYGSDRLYSELAREAIEGWRRWNAEWPEPLYHEVGFLGLCGGSLEPASFEGDSYRLNAELGARVERLDPPTLRRRFPSIGWPHGEAYLNRDGGWAESGAVVERLAALAQQAGVALHVGAGALAVEERSVTLTDGTRLPAERVVVAAGAWTPALVPESAPLIAPSGQSVVHFEAPLDGPLASLPVWCADIRRTGFYGFPSTDGRLKVGLHGSGLAADPEQVTELPGGAEARFRDRIATLLPEIAAAPIVHRRLCYYCDTLDGDFLIDRIPGRGRVVVAAGGSGHGFKFAPLLGRWIADRLEGDDSALPRRFGWRAPRPGREAARSEV